MKFRVSNHCVILLFPTKIEMSVKCLNKLFFQYLIVNLQCFGILKAIVKNTTNFRFTILLTISNFYTFHFVESIKVIVLKF